MDARRAHLQSMEFAHVINWREPVSTYRPTAKWNCRIRPGDVLRLSQIHCGAPQMGLARVIMMQANPRIPFTEEKRLAALYGSPLPPMTLIVLHHEPGPIEDHPELVRW